MSGSHTVPVSVIASLTEEVLQKGGVFSFAVRGISMRPLLQDGDRIEVGPLQKEKLVPGKILVYRGGEDGITVHRFMKLETQDGGATCWISPDTGPLCVEKVSLDRVLGVVQRVFRGNQELFLDRGWRFWWGRFLTFGFWHPWILRILFGLGRIGRRFFPD